MSSPLQKLQSLLNERPFRRFTLIFENGDRFVVYEPDMVVLASNAFPHAISLSEAQFAASYGQVRIEGRRTNVDAVEFEGEDGFPVELSMRPDEAAKSHWNRLRSWARIRKLTKVLIIGGIISMYFLPVFAGDDGGPINDVFRRQRIVRSLFLGAAGIAASAACFLYLLDRKIESAFWKQPVPIETQDANASPHPGL